MINSPILVLAFVASQVAVHTVAEWPQGMAQSKIAMQSDRVRFLTARLEHPAATVPGMSSQTLLLLSSGYSAVTLQDPGSVPEIVFNDANARQAHPLPQAVKDELHRLFVERARCTDLIAYGHMAEARASLERDMQDRPSEFFAIPLLNILLGQGEFIRAYKISAPFVRTGNASPSMLLRASLAAAECGEVYPGQRAFVESILEYNKWPKEQRLAEGESPEIVSALSAMAVGREQAPGISAIPFFEMASQADPTNAVICMELGHAYACTYQYSKAIEMLRACLERAKGTERTDGLRYFIDLYQSTKSKVGDGHPLFIAPPLQTPDRGTNPWKQ